MAANAGKSCCPERLAAVARASNECAARNSRRRSERLATDPRYDEEANTFEGRKTDRGEDAKGARAYMHSKAWHKMVHLLLEDLYVVWRTIEGLPVWPSYYSAKMGYGHGGMGIIHKNLEIDEQARARVAPSASEPSR